MGSGCYIREGEQACDDWVTGILKATHRIFRVGYYEYVPVSLGAQFFIDVSLDKQVPGLVGNPCHVQGRGKWNQIGIEKEDQNWSNHHKD